MTWKAMPSTEDNGAYLMDENGKYVAHVSQATHTTVALLASAPSLLAQRDALLEAGKLALEWLSDEDSEWEPYKKLRAALAMCEEGK